MTNTLTAAVAGLSALLGVAGIASRTVAATTAPPSTTPETEHPPLFDGDPEVLSGTYVVDTFDLPIEITVPDGWVAYGGFALLGPEDTFVAFWEVAEVPADACRWHEPGAPVGPTVDDLVWALAAQGSSETGEPNDIVVDGFAGKQLTLSVQAGIDLADCDDGGLVMWFDPTGADRFYFSPQESETLWILDLDGQRAIINAGSYGPVSAQTQAVIDEMLDSIDIEPQPSGGTVPTTQP